MKNINININAKNATIELTSKKFATAAAKFGTDAYKMLQEARRDYPTYKVVTVARKITKSAFKGLTYEYMEAYIEKHDDESKSIMADFKLLRGKTEEAEEAFAESLTYQEIKAWFFNQYPAIAQFHQKREAILAKA